METFVIVYVLATKDKQSGLNNLEMTPLQMEIVLSYIVLDLYE